MQVARCSSLPVPSRAGHASRGNRRAKIFRYCSPVLQFVSISQFPLITKSPLSCPDLPTFRNTLGMLVLLVFNTSLRRSTIHDSENFLTIVKNFKPILKPCYLAFDKRWTKFVQRYGIGIESIEPKSKERRALASSKFV